MNKHAPVQDLGAETRTLLMSCDVAEAVFMGSEGLAVRSPINGQAIARIAEASARDVSAAVGRAHEAFLEWRNVPAPKRGELVRLFGEELRKAKTELGRLVSIEAGKVISEGLGEVQE